MATHHPAIATDLPADLSATNLGTIIVIDAISVTGRRWLRKHVTNSVNHRTLAEHRLGWDILYGALTDGLSVRDTGTGQVATKVPEGWR